MSEQKEKLTAKEVKKISDMFFLNEDNAEKILEILKEKGFKSTFNNEDQIRAIMIIKNFVQEPSTKALLEDKIKQTSKHCPSYTLIDILNLDTEFYRHLCLDKITTRNLCAGDSYFREIRTKFLLENPSILQSCNKPEEKLFEIFANAKPENLFNHKDELKKFMNSTHLYNMAKLNQFNSSSKDLLQNFQIFLGLLSESERKNIPYSAAHLEKAAIFAKAKTFDEAQKLIQEEKNKLEEFRKSPQAISNLFLNNTKTEEIVSKLGSIGIETTKEAVEDFKAVLKNNKHILSKDGTKLLMNLLKLNFNIYEYLCFGKIGTPNFSDDTSKNQFREYRAQFILNNPKFLEAFIDEVMKTVNSNDLFKHENGFKAEKDIVKKALLSVVPLHCKSYLHKSPNTNQQSFQNFAILVSVLDEKDRGEIYSYLEKKLGTDYANTIELLKTFAESLAKGSDLEAAHAKAVEAFNINDEKIARFKNQKKAENLEIHSQKPAAPAIKITEAPKSIEKTDEEKAMDIMNGGIASFVQNPYLPLSKLPNEEIKKFAESDAFKAITKEDILKAFNNIGYYNDELYENLGILAQRLPYSDKVEIFNNIAKYRIQNASVDTSRKTVSCLNVFFLSLFDIYKDPKEYAPSFLLDLQNDTIEPISKYEGNERTKNHLISCLRSSVKIKPNQNTAVPVNNHLSVAQKNGANAPDMSMNTKIEIEKQQPQIVQPSAPDMSMNTKIEIEKQQPQIVQPSAPDMSMNGNLSSNKPSVQQKPSVEQKPVNLNNNNNNQASVFTHSVVAPNRQTSASTSSKAFVYASKYVDSINNTPFNYDSQDSRIDQINRFNKPNVSAQEVKDGAKLIVRQIMEMTPKASQFSMTNVFSVSSNAFKIEANQEKTKRVISDITKCKASFPLLAAMGAVIVEEEQEQYNLTYSQKDVTKGTFHKLMRELTHGLKTTDWMGKKPDNVLFGTKERLFMALEILLNLDLETANQTNIKHYFKRCTQDIAKFNETLESTKLHFANYKDTSTFKVLFGLEVSTSVSSSTSYQPIYPNLENDFVLMPQENNNITNRPRSSAKPQQLTSNPGMQGVLVQQLPGSTSNTQPPSYSSIYPRSSAVTNNGQNSAVAPQEKKDLPNYPMTNFSIRGPFPKVPTDEPSYTGTNQGTTTRVAEQSIKKTEKTPEASK